MSANDDFFKMVQDLVASRPFSVEGVAKVTGHKLHPEPNTAFFASQDDAHPSFQALDLRGPSFLSLEVQRKLCIEQKELTARFGDRPEMTFPLAHAPASAPMYLSYRQPWGELSFGFERTGRKCLVRVVIDATKK